MPRHRPTSVPSRTAALFPAATVFPIEQVLAKIATAIRPYRQAAMFELADEGYHTLFEQLVACLISIRTLDETTVPAAHALFALARTPEAMRQIPVSTIAETIRTSTFAEAKARNIHALAECTVRDFSGDLPCSAEILQSFTGVGPKCAHLAVGVACGQAFISVDVHVHRVTNRWGYVATKTPEKTMAALMAILPKKHWIAINRLLVPFGKHICTGRAPRCSTCPVRDACAQVGVTSYR